MEKLKDKKNNGCPFCGGKDIKVFRRTKGEITYIVYVCQKCRNVLRRELT